MAATIHSHTCDFSLKGLQLSQSIRWGIPIGWDLKVSENDHDDGCDGVAIDDYGAAGPAQVVSVHMLPWFSFR